ncbi:MAG: hypothetical protein ABSF00_13275 [Candidatus Bathyarchaeia archaeon]
MVAKYRKAQLMDGPSRRRSENPNAVETSQQPYPHWVETLPIKTADEAKAIAKDYLGGKER